MESFVELLLCLVVEVLDLVDFIGIKDVLVTHFLKESALMRKVPELT